MRDLSVTIGHLQLKNPVCTASGTFGDGGLMSRIYDVSRLGAIFAKGTTLEPREGNAPVRMAETCGGMLNAVGLQNRGLDYFIQQIYPEASQLGTEIIPNINGSSLDDYIAVAAAMNGLDGIHAVELNISCPNVKAGGMHFGVTESGIAEVVSAVRAAFDGTLIVKMTPNVTDIAKLAMIAEDNGADALSLVNTFLGMAVDAERQRPKLSTITGGLSGPAIKPIALRMVWQVYNAVKIPIVGIGGICTWEDAIEFVLCGASAVQVGTFNFVDPHAPIKIIDGIEDYMDRHGVDAVSQLIGQLRV